MSIPLNFNPLGYTLTSVGELPAGYTRLAFLQAPEYAAAYAPEYAGPYISMQITLTDSDDFSIKTEHRVLIKDLPYAEGCNKTFTFGQYLWLFYGKNAGGVFYMGVNPKTFESDFTVPNAALQWEVVRKNAVLEGKCGDATITPTTPLKSETYELGLFAALGHKGHVHSFTYPFPGQKYSWQFEKNGELLHDLLPAVDPAGAAGMFDKVTKTFFSNDGRGAFVAGIETLKQLQQLASNLPTVTDTPEIKLSLPGEWNGDESANAQLAIITGKGWSATITYRDVETSSSSSFVLGNRGDGGSALVLWCKAVESEYGNYQDADGVRYYVETCHDIWHPQELSPDDLGYTAALAQEDYLTERGLTAVPYEEEVLTANLADISL